MRNLTCPMCDKKFQNVNDFLQHIRNKPGHVEILVAEIESMRHRIELMEMALTAWCATAKPVENK